MKNIGIIGGGLAGLTSAILLARKDFDVILFEEKRYPFHRVCGEYISNENRVQVLLIPSTNIIILKYEYDTFRVLCCTQYSHCTRK